MDDATEETMLTVPLLDGGILIVEDLDRVQLERTNGIREITRWHTLNATCWCIALSFEHDRCQETQRYYERVPEDDRYMVNGQAVSREAFQVVFRLYGKHKGYPDWETITIG